MSERRMITTGMFMVDASIRWLTHTDHSIEVSYFVPGAFGHWQFCMAIKDPSVLLEVLKRVRDDGDVHHRGFYAYEEDGTISIVRESRAIVFDVMELDRLIGWLSEVEE